MSTEPKKKLQKSATDKMLFGVAGGLAEYLDVDPVLVRVGFIVLCLAGASGLLVYSALAIFMPTDSEHASGSTGVRDLGTRRGFGLLLILVGALMLLGNLGWIAWLPWKLGWPIATIVVGALILNARPRST